MAEQLLQRGWPVHLVNHLAAMSDLHRAGRFDRLTNDVFTLTGATADKCAGVCEEECSDIHRIGKSKRGLSVCGCPHATNLTFDFETVRVSCSTIHRRELAIEVCGEQYVPGIISAEPLRIITSEPPSV